MIDRSGYSTRVLRRGDPEPDDVAELGPSERIAMVSHLTLQAWAFKGLDHEPRLRRDVGRVVRGRSRFHDRGSPRGGGVRDPESDR